MCVMYIMCVLCVYYVCVMCVLCVHGAAILCVLDTTNCSSDFCPFVDYFLPDQHYAVFEFGDGGEALESYEVNYRLCAQDGTYCVTFDCVGRVVHTM